MSDETAIDRAHAVMTAAPEDDAARLAFFERLGDAELFILLTEEATDDTISPRIFDLGDVRVVLVFDREERLAALVGEPAPYAALSGRLIAGLLAGQGLGLGLNLDVAPSSFLLPADGVRWLADTLAHAPEEIEARFAGFSAPGGLPDRLVAGLDTKLATATGLAQAAYLVGTRLDGGGQGHLLAFVGAQPGAERALVRAVNEALTFSGIEAGALDVAFFDAGDAITQRLARTGLRFDLPQPAATDRRAAAAPGSDPARPPILK